MWWIPQIGAPWNGAIDIALVTLLIYGALVTTRGARAHLALLGIAILGVVYLLANQTGLILTATVFQAFFAVFLILIVIIFQQELRQAFERIAVLGLGGGEPVPAEESVQSVLASTLWKLAEGRVGALIVIPGLDPIDRHVRGGIELGGQLSEPLLLSVFDASSPGHDGAVILRGDRVERFAVHLPLSSNAMELRSRGTRHAAALGLSEQTDALCLVVSEERGQVSAAHRGHLLQLRSPAAIAEQLRGFAELQNPRAEPGGRSSRTLRAMRRNWREAALATGLSGLLWWLVVPGSELVEQSFSIPVEIVNLPQRYELDWIDPPEVDAVFAAPRREFVFLDRAELRIQLAVDDALMAAGRRTFEIEAGAVEHPAELRLTGVTPSRVRISVEEPEPSAPAARPE